MSTHSIYFCGEIRKNVYLEIALIWSSVFIWSRGYCIWVTISKISLSKCDIGGFRSSYISTVWSGSWSLLMHSTFSNDSTNGQQGQDQPVHMHRLILTFAVHICPWKHVFTFCPFIKKEGLTCLYSLLAMFILVARLYQTCSIQPNQAVPGRITHLVGVFSLPLTNLLWLMFE